MQTRKEGVLTGLPTTREPTDHRDLGSPKPRKGEPRKSSHLARSSKVARATWISPPPRTLFGRGAEVLSYTNTKIFLHISWAPRPLLAYTLSSTSQEASERASRAWTRARAHAYNGGHTGQIAPGF